MKFSIAGSLACTLMIFSACTNLDEKEVLYDQVTQDNFFKTDAEYVAALGAAYTNLYGMFGSSDNMWPMQEVPTDEIVVPTRGADWGDGGHWVRMKLHTYNADDPLPNGSWSRLYAGVNTCNRVLAVFEPIGTDQSKLYIAELKCLRAIYYYWLLDMFGNVPLSIDFSQTEPPSNSTRQEVYDFIESELIANMDALPKTGPNDDGTYGRVNYYTAQATLAKLYLNANVYTGKPEWDKCIAACDAVINSGQYALMANYQDNFTRDDKGSTEFIWVIPYDGIKATGFTMPLITLNPIQQGVYNLGLQPWGGFASVQEFYQSYIDPTKNPGPQGSVIGLDPLGTPTTGTLDSRLSNFIVGPQYGADGVTQIQDGAAEGSDPDGPALTFTPYINELEPGAWHQAGARIGKWEIYKGGTGSLDNDYCIFRFADILLTKAEALCRKNNNWNDAVALAIVNQVRTTHGKVDAFTSMTEDKFLEERGREMFAEATRRQDLIRFGRYNNASRFRAADPADNAGPNGQNHRNVFPIPATQINANKNLKQNPGY